jgi:hypothetical protein
MASPRNTNRAVAGTARPTRQPRAIDSETNVSSLELSGMEFLTRRSSHLRASQIAGSVSVFESGR